MKLILPLLLSLVATSALAHKDHDHEEAPVIKPQQVAPKAEAAMPDAKKATQPAEKPKTATPAAEPAPKAKSGG